jgi:hypothetical protein
MLENPDADIRYDLPDFLNKRSNGNIGGDGYDYVGPDMMLLFLEVRDVQQAVACIVDVIENVRFLENDLRKGAVAAIETDGGHEVFYPADFKGPLIPERT